MSIDCREVIRNLYQLVDRELPEEERRKLEGHVDVCNECLRRLNIEKEFKELIRKRCCEEAPEELRETIRRRLRAEIEGY